MELVFTDHLHPGVTIASIAVTQAEMLRNGTSMPAINIYYFDKAVYQVATTVLTDLSSGIAVSPVAG